MKLLRNKLALAVAGVTFASGMAQAEGFQLSEKLSVTGFIDMSTTYTDPEDKTVGSDTSSGLDQFEMDFLYAFDDKLTAQVDVEYQDDGRTVTDSNGDTVPIGEEVDVEQAFFNYAVNEQLSFKAGRFLSYSGWETEEPTGLFQYSGAGYAGYFYGGYQQGMSVLYSADTFAVAASVVNELGDLEGEARDSTKPGMEAMVAVMPTESITAKAFYLTDEDETTGEDIEMFDFWAMFTSGSLTLAAEYAMSEDNPVYASTAGIDSEADGMLVMANYAMDKIGVTLRYHAWEVEDGSGVTVEEMTGITLSPSYKVNDNLLIVAEYRRDKDKLAPSDADETDSMALEALISF